MVEQLLFAEYFYQWMKTFKKPAIAPVTYIKYKNTYEHIKNYFGTIELAAVSRQDYQAALNKFAKTHAKRTTAGFHKQMRAAVLDALEENFISTETDPTVPTWVKDITQEDTLTLAKGYVHLQLQAVTKSGLEVASGIKLVSVEEI